VLLPYSQGLKRLFHHPGDGFIVINDEYFFLDMIFAP
jgi:hypothetical protein